MQTGVMKGQAMDMTNIGIYFFIRQKNFYYIYDY